jgi:DNA-binding response OmpR family regulator
VFEAAGVAEAKAVLNADTPVDLVFSDVNLALTENGFALATWIRQQHPDTKVVLTSGAPGAAEKARDLCMDGLMPKPYEHEAVLRRIQALLRQDRRAKRGE